MQEELISKKDLLVLTNISYGQLYRWKRKGLIPEDWFIRKSTYTGQETFFPRSQILSRIDRIKNMKEEVSLNDLADVFSPSPDNITLLPDEVVKQGIIAASVMERYLEGRSDGEALNFEEILSAYIFSNVITSGDVSLDEARLMLEVYRTSRIKYGDAPGELFLTRKLGVFGCFAVLQHADICFDRDTKLVAKIDLRAVAEELKLRFV